MVTPKPHRWRSLSLWVVLTLALAGTLLLTACSPIIGYHTDERIEAQYFGRTLTTHLDWRVPISSASAAASQAMLARGYVIESRQESEDRTHVVGVLAGDTMFEKTIIRARITREGTTVKITVEPIGDEAIARTILDEMLVHLGY